MIYTVTRETPLVCKHYGAAEFNPQMFRPIRNGYSKPAKRTGLWTCPAHCTNDWEAICQANEMRVHSDFSKKFHVEFTQGSRIVVINGMEDIVGLPVYMNDFMGDWYLDYEAITASGIAGIWMTETGLENTGNTEPPDLFGWDCESVLVLNVNNIHAV